MIERYADASGRDLSDINFFKAFGYWKLTCIIAGVYAGTGRMSIALVAYVLWREKPTTFMLIGAVLILISGWLAANIARKSPVPPPQL